MAMGRGSALLHLALLNFLTLSTIFSRLSSATQYTVGGSQEWNLNVDYTTWAAQYSFKTGDTLLFSYNAEEHSVLQVSQADYGSCTISNPIKSYDDGSTVVALAQATTYYFVCGVPGHCGQGMQVAIKVGAGTSTPPTSTPSTPPPASTPPPTSTPPISTPPPTSTPPISTPPPASAPPISTPSAPPSIASSPTPSTTSPTPSPSPSPSPSPTPSISPSPTTPSSSPTSSPSSSNPSSLSPSTPPSTIANSSPSPKAILSFTILLGALRFILL